jgi:membrane protein YdbS with pleckstrin-like domain
MRELFLRLLRIPERPAPPPGAGDSLRVFRASRNFLAYSLLEWGVRQALALVGILIPFSLLGVFTREHLARVNALAERFEGAELLGQRLDVLVPKLVSLAEVLVGIGFVVQLVVSGLLLKLGWEMRWYMVSDTSLRIREGLIWVRERTMTVANIQKITVKQGPLQRLLGIADVEVYSAGGGASVEGTSEVQKRKQQRARVGRFRGVKDAERLRDSLSESLARHRDTGLGDPDARGATTATGEVPGQELREVVRTMIEESRRLRRALEVDN